MNKEEGGEALFDIGFYYEEHIQRCAVLFED